MRLYASSGDVVAPHAGAWIETELVQSYIDERRASPLTQGRGLKLYQCAVQQTTPRSPLTQGRGLKLPFEAASIDINAVAPHAGAWIETLKYWAEQADGAVAPHAGAWIETTPGRTSASSARCRPSRRGVD